MKPSSLMNYLKCTIPAQLPTLIKGAPGIGKTDIVKQACDAVGAELFISHPVVSDPVDYKGMPFVVDGEAHFLPFGELQVLIKADKLLVFFLDDLGQAPASVQAAAMQLILARRVNGHVVSPNVCFLAATNRKQDKAGVSGILEPVKSRFCSIIELNPDLNDWVAWALGAGIPTELIAFIRYRSDFLHDFKPTADITNSPCPRTLHNVGKLMQVGLPPELEYDVFSGAAGEAFAAEFTGFLRIFRTLPNPDLIMMDPDKAEVPSDPATLYALCGALSRKASDNTMERIVRYANRMPADFSVLLIKDCKDLNPDVLNTRAYIEWAVKHQDVNF